MTINRKICPPGLKNNPNKNLTSINYITIHTTGNYAATAGAKNHADYLFNGSAGAQASWHYSVDAKEIWQSFEDRQMCWHAGDGSSGPGNSTSIGVEICVNDKAAFKKACENAAWLTAELLKRHKLTIDKVVPHNRWSGKNCPMELRSGAWGVTWADFIGMVKKALEPPAPVPTPTPPVPAPPTDPNKPSDWAEESWAWAKREGITDGTRPKDNTTREQTAAMLHRALEE